MLHIRLIKYLTYFFEFLDDNLFEELIKLFFGRNDYFFQNNRYKEFFLHILLSQLAKLPIYKPYDKMQILLDKRKFEDYRFEFDFEEEYAKNLFMHLKCEKFKNIFV